MNNKKDINTDLYAITAEELSCKRDNIEIVETLIDSGIKVIQYREKEKNLIDKYNQCKKIRELTRKANVTFIVNDNIDLALIVEADGVHIGQKDLPVPEVRKLVGEKMIIGLSTHSPEQAEDAVKKDIDYIGVGPIYETNTKKDVCAPVGLEYLSYVSKNIKIPFVAIGGIKEHNISDVIKNGAKTIALVSEIVGAEDIKNKITRLRNKFI